MLFYPVLPAVALFFPAYIYSNHQKKCYHMKKLFHTPVFSRLGIFGLAFVVLLLAACSKNDDNNFDQPSSARLMLFNLAPDKPAVGFTISGNQLGNASLGYTSYSGVYLPIFAATRELRAFDTNNGATIATSTDNYADSSYYSAFLIGANGVYRNVVTRDDYSAVVPAAGKAWVRYINAVTDTVTSPNVTIAGTTEAAAFGTVSGFKQVDAGSLNTAITSGTFDASRTITVAENRIYTILFVGQPGATDPLLAPQVKFIENGTASN